MVSFAQNTLAGSWRGRREREAVSQFAFGHLLQEVAADRFLSHPAQIAIEFPVPQVDAGDAQQDRVCKAQVCKDLVIWPEPGMTCWDAEGLPTVPPAAILEWKFGAAAVHEPDIEWLRMFTLRFPSTTGYAITANRPGAPFLLDCVRIERGAVVREWLRL